MQRYFPLGRREGMEPRLGWHTLRQHPWVMVWTMAIAQIISWGTLFYSFSLFVVPMEESLGWSRPLLNGALSLVHNQATFLGIIRCAFCSQL